MGRYTKFQDKPTVKQGLHPIWRGIGCLLILIVILVSYGLTTLLVPALIATGKIPHELAAAIQFPTWVFKVPFLSSIGWYLSKVPNPWLNTITFLLIILVLSGVTSYLYSVIYKIVGPERYSVLDAPPTGSKTRKYTR